MHLAQGCARILWSITHESRSMPSATAEASPNWHSASTLGGKLLVAIWKMVVTFGKSSQLVGTKVMVFWKHHRRVFLPSFTWKIHRNLRAMNTICLASSEVEGKKSINYTDTFPRLKISRELNPKLTAWSLSKGVFKMKPCTSSWSDSVRPVSDLMVFQGDDRDQTMISIYVSCSAWVDLKKWGRKKRGEKTHISMYNVWNHYHYIIYICVSVFSIS